MKQFHSPRTFHRRRRWRLRHAVYSLAALGLLWAGASFFSAPAADDSRAAELVAVAAPVAAPAPKIIPESSPAATPSLKAAFEAEPAAPEYSFGDPTAEELAAIEPGAGNAAGQAQSGLSRIQKSIGNMLDAGSDYLAQSTKTLSVGRGDTLMDLLVKNDVPREDAYKAIQALAKVYDPRKLKPAHEITVFFHEDPAVADPQFSGLSIQKDVISTVRVSRADDGQYTVGQEEKTVRTELRAFSGGIDSSLYVSAKAAGLGDNVLLDLIRIYSWSVDFQREIQPGDSFEVMYEQATTEDGEAVPGQSKIVYATLNLGGQPQRLYLFRDSEGDEDYFDENGRSTKKTLMKTPIDGARLSSGFGMRRHPVLGYSKMHKGMDFAAPSGTPIYAAGDGTIARIGPFSSYGKYIRIRHRSGLETAYAHMKGFKSGLKAGSRVKQGQVIGYVGTTGRSTGPHLHYEVLMNGRQVNAATIKLPTGKELKGADLNKFKSVAGDADRQFKKLSTPVSVAGLQGPGAGNR